MAMRWDARVAKWPCGKRAWFARLRSERGARFARTAPDAPHDAAIRLGLPHFADFMSRMSPRASF